MKPDTGCDVLCMLQWRKPSYLCSPLMLPSGVSSNSEASFIPMGSCEALVLQLLSGSPSEQHQAVAALSVLPLTSKNWLSAVGAIPRLIQLLCSTSRNEPQARATRCLLEHITTSKAYLRGSGLEAAPDGVIPPLVSSLLLSHDDEYVCHVAALRLLKLAPLLRSFSC